MERKFLDQTLWQALGSTPRLLSALEKLPALNMTVEEAAKRHELLMRDPVFAMETGVAKGDDGERVGVYGCSETNAGVYGESKSGFAGFFEGDVWVTGRVNCPDVKCEGRDCAEEFDTRDDDVEPGTVMTLGDEGVLRISQVAYDTCVAGVVSGAGEFKPGIVLGSRPGNRRAPIALVGRVFCKVDASYGPIALGSLLTTSDTSGHAMAAREWPRACGTVLGKALRPLTSGRGLIPILVALQ